MKRRRGAVRASHISSRDIRESPREPSQSSDSPAPESALRYAFGQHFAQLPEQILSAEGLGQKFMSSLDISSKKHHLPVVILIQ